jgi:hypothetical protein
MIARILILFLLRVFICIVVTIIIPAVISKIIRITSLSIRCWINMRRRRPIICHRYWWDQNVPIGISLQHSAIVQLRLLQWLFLHLYLFCIFLFGFRLHFLWIFLNFSLWLNLLGSSSISFKR